jgi:predicted nucleic acid-binding protein
MNVVDSSGWLEYFGGGASAGIFAPVVQETEALVAPTICMYEVFKRVLIQRGEESALQAIGIMSLGAVAELTQEVAIDAARISFELKLAMADSVILATARAYDAILWTKDADFEGLDGVQYIKG